jgi:hypothetical protein
MKAIETMSKGDRTRSSDGVINTIVGVTRDVWARFFQVSPHALLHYVTLRRYLAPATYSCTAVTLCCDRMGYFLE